MDGENHQIGSWLKITGGDINTGCRVIGTDTVDAHAAFDIDGTLTWPIEWQYRVPGGNPETFYTATHSAQNKNSTCTISKAQSKQYSKQTNDPDSNY